VNPSDNDGNDAWLNELTMDFSFHVFRKEFLLSDASGKGILKKKRFGSRINLE
jgi:hypothetical protein